MSEHGAKGPKSLRKGLPKELEETLDEAEWLWLAPHLARDALIMVSIELDLLEVAEKVVRDDKKQISKWIEKGLLAKPTREQIEVWTGTPKKKFLTVIAQPYVLAQELLLH